MAPHRSTTQAVYLYDGRALTHSTTITSLVPLSSLPDSDRTLFKQEQEQEQETPSLLHHVLTTSSTIFYPQGGGQPSDVGSISASSASSSAAPDANSTDTATTTTNTNPSPSPSPITFTVTSVRRSPTTSILHCGHFSPPHPLPLPHPSFHPPLPCTQHLSPPTRLLHSRIHTAGHLLSGAVSLLALPGITEGTRAMHFPGSAFVDFGGSIPGTSREAIQAKCDELVQGDRGVGIRWWGWEEAERRCKVGPGEMGLRREEEGEGEEEEGGEGATKGKVRVVEIEGAGAYPCGGTHVERTGEVGRVVVRRISRTKGTSKISYAVE